MKRPIIVMLACVASSLAADESVEPPAQHTHREAIRTGHVDLLILYEAEKGLHIAIGAGETHEHESGHEAEGAHGHPHAHQHAHVALDNVEIVVGPKGMHVPSAGPAWSFLGGPQRYSYVLPQSEINGLPFLGLNTEELVEADFATVPTLTLTSVEGPGNFFLYQVDAFGEPVIRMDSADSAEDSTILPLGTHLHMNWAFSEPGHYALTFEVSATLTGGTQLVSAPQVVHFMVVGQTTFIHEGHADIGLRYEPDHGLEFYVAAEGEHHHHGDDDHANETEHEHDGEEHDHGQERHPADVTFLLSGYTAMTVPDERELAFLGNIGSTVYLLGQQAQVGAPFVGWSSEGLDPSVLSGELRMELLGINGPGEVFLWEMDAFGGVTVLWNSSDPGEDVLTLPIGIHRHYNLAVTQPGTYELEVHAEGLLVAGSEVHADAILTLQAGGMQGYFGHFERTAPDWIHAETGGWLYTAHWPWLWSPHQGWLHAFGSGGPAHYYFRAEDQAWLWTTPGVFPFYWTFEESDWAAWSGM